MPSRPTHPVVIPLASARADQVTLVGGKAVGLGELIRAGAPVPAGFVITTRAFAEAVAGTPGLAAAIAEALATVQIGDPGSAVAAARTIAARFDGLALPAALAASICAAYRELGRDVAVAVRSSATTEDLADASSAGQQESFLNVVGDDRLVAAVRACWASLWSGPAIAYRQRQGTALGEVAMAVVVQVLIPADSAGVLFTADPLSGDRDRVVIEATWGLGDALVGGVVTPDQVILDKASGAVVGQRIADKTVMTVCRADGVQSVAVPDERRRVAVLQAGPLEQLLGWARSLEASAGHPLDIEWVCRDGMVLLTQSRPITTLPPDLLGMTWSREMLIERYPDPLTPLTWSAVDSTFFASLRTTLHALGGELPADVPMIRLIHGRAYVNTTAFEAGLQSLPLRPPVQAEPAAAADQDPSLRLGRAQARAAVQLVRLVLGTYRDWERRLPAFRSAVQQDAATRWGELPTAVLLAARREQAARLEPMLDNHARAIVAADLTLQVLGGICRRWLGDDSGELLLRLLSGLTGNLTVETNRALWRLAQLGEQSPGFDDALTDFLRSYGHRSPRYEFAHPTWGEQPDQVRALARLVAQGSPDPGLGEAERARDRLASTAAARRRLSRPRRLVFDWALALAQTYFRLRENQQFHLVSAVPTLRAILLELGARFTASGLLPEAGDIFLLETGEVDSIAALLGAPGPGGGPGPGLADVPRLVEQRRARLAADRQLTPPVVLGGPGHRTEPGLSERLAQSGSGQALHGIPASGGSATGPARIVRGPEDFTSVQPGDILVAPATSPAWTPLFGVVAGLVTEFGGLLSHAGVVAREYGLPAVLGVTDAIQVIPAGAQVCLDAGTGTVTVLDTQPGATP
jgi:phosphohistidine swiveling domain-containing protein